MKNLSLRHRLWVLAAVCLVAAPLSLNAFPMGMGIGRTVSLGSLTLTGVFPRIFTPNGDGANDKVGFHFDNPEDLPVGGTVYDISGARVADLTPTGNDPSSLLTWDGKDSAGRTVAGGIYIYQIEYQGKHATGTIVVAR